MIVTGVGDHARLSEVARSSNFVVRHVKKQVPALRLPGAVRFNDALQQGASQHARRRSRLDHDDLAFLQYTGGTTGVAKGAMLTHRNMVANMLQAERVDRHRARDRRGHDVITALPLYHIFALTANCLVFMQLGGTTC